MRVTLLQPKGARSCRDATGRPGPGGPWVDSDDFAHEGGATKRLAACVAGLHPNVQAHVKAELLQLLTGARLGQLHRWDDAKKAGQVRPMSLRKRVLELRLRRQIDPKGDHRHIRLYFTEPAHESILLALLLDWKADPPPGKAKQQIQIWLADRRLDDHYAS